MEQINLKLKRTKIKLEVDDKVYMLTRPTYSDVKAFEAERKLVAEDPEKLPELIFMFLEKTGLPKDVANNLEVSMITEIIDVLSGVKKN